MYFCLNSYKGLTPTAFYNAGDLTDEDQAHYCLNAPEHYLCKIVKHPPLSSVGATLFSIPIVIISYQEYPVSLTTEDYFASFHYATSE